LILQAKTVTQDFLGAETPGSFDAYRSAKDAGVSAPVEALLLGFIGNQGKVSFSENWFACEFGPLAALTGRFSEIAHTSLKHFLIHANGKRTRR
jgi:hypothetical protein